MTRVCRLLVPLIVAACAPLANAPDAGDDSPDAATDDAGADAGSPDGGAAPAPGCDVPAETRLDAWTSDPRLCVSQWSDWPGHSRGLALAPDGDLYVVSRQQGIVALWDDDGDGRSGPAERSVFVSQPRALHGIEFRDGWIYGSNDTTVWRWEWSPGRRVATTEPQTVVRDLPPRGHSTRTLRFDLQGRLLVSVGSADNVDPGTGEPLPDRALIRRYDLSTIPEGGIPARDGVVFASGLRNEVGLTYDDRGRLWGVENGRDNLREGGQPIHTDNPAEELHRFPAQPGSFFGYPYCWTEYLWAGGLGRGAQHVDESMTGGHDDAWCRDPTNNHPPALAMPAHLAPLGVTFVRHAPFAGPHGALVVASHGSWNRQPTTGRILMRAVFDAAGNVHEVEPIAGEKAADGSLQQGLWKYRPVDVVTGRDGALYVSDDNTGTVLRIGWTGE